MKKVFTLITIHLTFGLMGMFSAFSQCSSGFTSSVDSLTVTFTNQATGAYNYIEYDFGDGNWLSYVANPVHTYDEEGVYQVCQLIFDTISFQCFDSYCETVFIGDATCQADFWWFNNGLEVEFYAQALGDYDSLSFDFGDFTTSNDTMPMHTYAAPGWYTVCLSLFDSAGAICDSTCQLIYLDTTGCEADFEADANGLSVDFTNLSSGNYNAVSWDFGDGFGMSLDEDPSYTYFIAGTYDVCLMVYDSLFGNCFSEVCKEVTVTTGGGGGLCNADFDYTQQELSISCENTSTGSFITSFWDFGDGSNPSIDPFYTYAEPGTYEVCLTVGNLFPFCFDQHCETVTVTQFNCEPSFTYGFNPVSNVFSFNNTTAVGNVTSVKWEFGDGNTTTFANPSYTYNVPGIYTVCLNTYDGDDLCGVTCSDVEVYPLGNNELAGAAMSVSPNPSNGHVMLNRGGVQGVLNIGLLDVGGRLLYTSIDQDNELVDLNFEVPAGIYFLRVGDKNANETTFKLVVQ